MTKRNFIGRMLGGGARPAEGPAAVPEVTPSPAHVAPDEPADQPAFPYPLVTVHGIEALETWHRLRREGAGWPVVLGSDEDLQFIVEGLEDRDPRAPEAILAAAEALSFPASLAGEREAEARANQQWAREQGHGDEAEGWEPPLGDWPDRADGVGFTIATDVLTGAFLERVHIAVLPCATGAEAPAYLNWGGWNENPAPELHVAALRSWHERFGAELVGMSDDVVNLHVATRPGTREAALALAREQYLYCTDIVDQGTQTLSALAAALMADDWWYFWWD